MTVSQRVLLIALVFLFAPDAISSTEDLFSGWSREPVESGPKFDYGATLISFRDTLWVTEAIDPANLGAPDYKRTRDHWALWDGHNWIVREMPFRIDELKRKVRWQDWLVFGGNRPFSPGTRDSNWAGGTGLTAFDGSRCFPVSEGFSGIVSALAVWKGDLIVAGELSIKDLPGLTHLARWDGKAWHPVGGQPAGGGESRINCLTVFGDRLVAGGLFSHLGEAEANNLAAFDGQTWAPLGPGANHQVKEAAVFDGSLFVFGDFTCIGGLAIRELASWDGRQWSTPNPSGESSRIFHWGRSGRLLSTPEGLYVSGLSPKISGRANALLDRWGGRAWDASLPRLMERRTKKFFANDQNENPHPSKTPFEQRPYAKPRPWPDPPQPVEEHELWASRRIQDLVRHDGQIIVLSDGGAECVTTTQDYRVHVLTEDRWQDLLPKSKPASFGLCAYRGCLLEGVNEWTGGASLWIRPQGLRRPVSEDFRNLEGLDWAQYLARGDSLFVALPRWSPLAQEFHHVAVFDGSDWHPLGDGLPFDTMHDPTWAGTSEATYLSGRFSNRGAQSVECLFRWDGKAWDMLERNEGGPRTLAPLGASGADLFRAVSPTQISEWLKAPDHSTKRFPAVNRPRIERWTGSGWETVWEGRSGVVFGFAGNGRDLWAAIRSGEDANLLHLVNGTWEVASTTPLPGSGETDINPLVVLSLYRGKPIVVVQTSRKESLRRLAFWENGQWRWLGGPLRECGKVIPTPDRLWVQVKRTINGPAMIWWDGDMSGPLVEPFDLEEMNALKAVCQAADQADRPDLELPWPKGLKKYRNQDRQGAGSRPGWHMSSWPDSIPRDRVVDLMDDGTMVMDARLPWNLVFTFLWPKEKAGQVEFEFRVDRPAAWASDFGPLKIPFHHTNRLEVNESDHPRLKEFRIPPAVDVTGGERWMIEPLALFPLDDRWHKVGFQFDASEKFTARHVVFDPGVTGSMAGHFEIRNVRFRKGRQSSRELCKEVSGELMDYEWPVPVQPALKRLIKSAKDFDWKTEFPFTDRRSEWWGLADPSGIHSALVAWGSNHVPEKKEISASLAGLVSHQGRWITGGALYVSSMDYDGLGVLQDILPDPEQVKFLSGIILDWRLGGYGLTHPAEDHFDRTAEKFGMFYSTPITWAHYRTTPTTDLIPLTTIAGETPWPDDLPVVAIIGPNTPGHLVLLLNALPQVTTIGQPSGPVIVPTRPHLLSNGRWAFFPEGQVFDANGKNVSLCRIPPDRIVSHSLSWDMAVREAMAIIGIEPDPENDFCPLN